MPGIMVVRYHHWWLCHPMRRVFLFRCRHFLLLFSVPFDRVVALNAWFHNTVECLVVSVMCYTVFWFVVGCPVEVDELLRVVIPYTSQALIVSLMRDEVFYRMIVRQMPRPARPHHRSHLDPLLGRLRFVNVRRRMTLY